MPEAEKNILKKLVVDPLSVIPLFLECYADQLRLATGTGFVVQKSNDIYLVTNWHILSGRDSITHQPSSPTGLTPDRLAIWHHIKGKLGTWGQVFVPLRKSDGSASWLELQKDNKIMDVALLHLSIHAEVQTYPLDLALADTDLVLAPSEPVSIVGFPFGLSSGGSGRFAIWKTGHIASDLDIDYSRLPVFLIDSTTKPGMSGSPVVACRIGMHRSSEGISMGGEATRFLGVYSGRIHGESDIGMVWKPEVIRSLMSQQ